MKYKDRKRNHYQVYPRFKQEGRPSEDREMELVELFKKYFQNIENKA